MDMMLPIVTELTMLEQGVPVFDAYLQKEVLFVAPALAFLCDNPRHSKLLNHLGGNAKKYCRMCMVCIYMYLYVVHGVVHICTYTYMHF